MTNLTTATFSEIEQELKSWNGRRRVQALLIWAPRGLMVGLGIALVLAAVSRFRPFMTNQEVGLAGLICAAVGIVGGILFALLRRYSINDQAIYADQQFGLRERVTSALELHQGTIDAPPDIRRSQLEDTLSTMRRVDVEKGMPLTIDTQELVFVLAAIALLAAAAILPNAQSNILQGQRAVQQVVAEQIDRLEELQEQIEQNPELTAEQREELLEPITEARQTLEDGVESREEALATLSDAESELRELSQQNNTDSLERDLADASGNFESAAGQPLGQAMQEGDLEQTAEELENLADSVEGLSESEQQALGSELSQAASELQETNPELAESLAEAGSALQQGDAESASDALAEAGETAEGLAEQAEVAEAAEGAADSLTESRQEVTENQEGDASSGAAEDGQFGQAEGGQGGQGEAGQDGEGATQGEGEGQGLGQPNNQAGNGGGQAGGGGEGGGSTDNVFVPPFRDLSEFEGVDIELDADCEASPENCGELLSTSPTDIDGDEESVVPYEEVYAEYANTAYETLSEDYIPIGMKGYIRDYFSSLEPEAE